MTFSTIDPKKQRFSNHTNSMDLSWTLPLHPELSRDLVQSRNSLWPRSQVLKDNIQVLSVCCRTQDIPSVRVGYFALGLPELPKADQRQNLTLVQGLCSSPELPQAAHGPAAPLLSIRILTEYRKAILALRLELTPSIFGDIGFKPSLFHLYQA